MRQVSFVIIATLATLLGACVERAPELSPADRERLDEFIGTERPDPEHDLNVQFENGVTLLGYDISSETATEGQPVTITWHWHAADDLDDGWQMFTHVADGAGENRLNQDGVGVVREIYQPGRWQAGQYIRDVQEVTLPADWNSNEAVFYLGLWNGPHRLAIRSGTNDGDNRVRALTLTVAEGTSAEAEPAEGGDEAPTRRATAPSMRIERAGATIVIDGNLNEAAWREAAETDAFVNTVNGSAAPFRAMAASMWDDENLYVAFRVRDDFVQNTLEGRDAHLWEQDAVEIMIDPRGDGRNYFELQVSPTGEVFDTRYDTRRNPGPIGHADWNAQIQARAVVNGTANDDEADEGYTVEIAIAWSSFETGEPPAGRPEANSRWRLNFYVMDQRQGDAPDRAAGWSPTLEGDFHVPNRFGLVTFAGPPEEIAAADVPTPAGQMRIGQPQIELSPDRARAVRRSIELRNLDAPIVRAVRP